MVAVRELDSDPEHDQYELDMMTVPGVEDHRCGNTGMEEMIKQFRKEVEEEVRREPTQPFPALYLRIRSKFSQKLSVDAKNLFLSQIPAYESLQTSMYRLRRKFIPAAPATQAEFDTSLDWFLCDQSSRESVVKGDILHSDGLQIILFSTEDSLQILSRAQTILADGTFRITPHLWYQTFILSASFRENSFVPVCFGFLPDKKRRSYDDFYTLLRQALEHPTRKLKLSAEWIMSDFEHNIRTGWAAVFPEVQTKGCHFHYAKVGGLLFL